MENMAEFRPGLCSEAAQQGLMQWLLKRIKVTMATVKQEVLKLTNISPKFAAAPLHSAPKLDFFAIVLMKAIF